MASRRLGRTSRCPFGIDSANPLLLARSSSIVPTPGTLSWADSGGLPRSGGVPEPERKHVQLYACVLTTVAGGLRREIGFVQRQPAQLQERRPADAAA
jgi:hypothetical protein